VYRVALFSKRARLILLFPLSFSGTIGCIVELGGWHMMDGLFLEESSSYVVVVVSAA
jgi:hypothetical protein